MAPQLHRNCTSDRPTCSFPELLPQTNTYCQLVKGAPSSRCLRLCFSTLYRKYFPHLRAHQKPHCSTLLSFTKLVVKKSRRRRFVPSGTSDELLKSFHHSYASIAQSEGFQQQATRVSPQTVDLLFSTPPPHDDTSSIRNSFTSQTPQGSQRLQPTSSFLSMTKTLFFSPRRRSCCRGMPLSHSGGQVSPQQPTPISKGIKTLRAFANTAYTFSSRYKRKQRAACSRCAKRRITPA